jgi:LmbE family N-acetylglucosaminyl deacetylase
MKWLILCAHPDDLEFFVGHLLYALSPKNPIPDRTNPYIGKSKSHEVIIASMTRGEMSSFTFKVKSTKKAAEIRTKEFTRSCELLGHKPPLFLGFFDGFVRVSEQAVQKLQKLFMDYQPDIVIAPEPKFTYYPHTDHVRTGRIAFYAICRMMKERTQNPQLTIKIPSLYYFGAFFNHFYFPQFPEFEPIIKKALAAHESQQDILIPARIPALISGKSNGRKIPGVKMAEALRKQFIPGKSAEKEKNRFLPPLGWSQKILFYLTWNDNRDLDYAARLRYYDGTIN